ncbi:MULTISPECIES: Fe-S cluster assembly sulfur transfer protein SufU [Caproicibacterium]|jgi:nitrogen fixation NifU-like protein|uniref:SUF system NifU family Fe-S cluster assembly protein n=1 Tax=Caproicibacterium lactatifermentans TaxID=2666138 RepID=A0A859DWZ4_9FIRM|nr:SUF system NifU family Fe-S cluster assembly protein [Caproicibacterium lactatifermentans]ARP49769.1 SUF system NifU family Fe-S cluster assembly protein [Ruminococcaceae bacterium CPB6]MDD4807780.1 SUF system NifU family Fe-S cluster assembly protein [Oscillospiraceae bacterium]QKN24501.1 SUF system NifU family Fe-S cluster assembly protein [Caproicibacterium lactatifermentans]QKO30485.1 SUF system NifU family Fe-S cluster assembly protein [Caproicibacterium lactatifermentans]
MGLEQIYTQIITENSRSTEHKYQVQGPTQVVEGVNPSCGDDITLQLRVKDGVIEDAAFLGDGCAISQASASIMIDLIKGKTLEEAQHLSEVFLGMIKGTVKDEDQLDQLEDAQAFKDISHMPARVKCAVLGWHTLQDAVAKADKSTKAAAK